MLLELATFHAASIPVAEKSGVHRLELCEGYAVGGLTPSVALFEFARAAFSSDIFVMIRPRGGDFCFTGEEAKAMLKDIRQFRQLGANGVVSGCFRPDGEMDTDLLLRMVDACEGLPFTFHRSFDALPDWQKGLDMLLKAGCTRLLTSGDGKTAEEGLVRLKEMHAYSNGALTILPGGGIRAHNLLRIIKGCAPAEIHTAAITTPQQEVADARELETMLALLSRSDDKA